MKHLGTIIGTAIAGMFVMGVWGAFAGAYGIAGGWFAGLMIIGVMWYMNHYIGIVNNEDGAAWIDMALGIAVAGTTRDAFMAGNFAPIASSMPTLIIVILGGITGGVTAGLLQKHVLNKKEFEKETV
ncbi:Lin0368 family putative glycerol transporter subunit [Tepidibacter formicigenes]|uniref:Uncharacterized protein n=1 Tax=Tepidibacter formicigenes DSM 15518 TaxID=1123349 RepID=A0A1M6TAY0_9FIRM|nr:hypothetical protein [Tepidibacter formicigenes]SHK54145.1 hypothetical protein SAMN02744037_02556 [Tepidibacter formicigenes DSM 15518]